MFKQLVVVFGFIVLVGLTGCSKKYLILSDDPGTDTLKVPCDTTEVHNKKHRIALDGVIVDIKSNGGQFHVSNVEDSTMVKVKINANTLYFNVEGSATSFDSLEVGQTVRIDGMTTGKAGVMADIVRILSK